MKILTRLLTNNLKEIPLLNVTFNYTKFKYTGKVNSCMCNLHPMLQNDDKLIKMTNDLVDYIRDNYDMDLIP